MTILIAFLSGAFTATALITWYWSPRGRPRRAVHVSDLDEAQ